MNELECKRCGHKWQPRVIHPPVQCPFCKSINWQKEPDTKEAA